jgi:GNAT superfamily N-acetyltransferase
MTVVGQLNSIVMSMPPTGYCHPKSLVGLNPHFYQTRSKVPVLIVREFHPADLPAVLDLHRLALQSVGAYIGDGPWDDDLRDITRQYDKNLGSFLVGTLNETIVSTGAFRKVDENVAEIKRMRTHPDYQRRSFASQILRELIRQAIALRYGRLILETSEKQTAAHALYGKHGFIEYKKEVIHGMNCTWYSLDLNKPEPPNRAGRLGFTE